MCDGTMTPDICSGNYATLNNTPGIGDAVPFGTDHLGSGDLFNTTNNRMKKRIKKTSGNDIMNQLSPRPLIVRK